MVNNKNPWPGVLVALPVLSVTTGLVVALFLLGLDAVTRLRFNNPWLLYLLPVAGVLIYFIYRWAGSSVAKGNNLVINAAHKTEVQVPGKMAPAIFITTLITHLFGGSAGREGTAVQIGGSIAGYTAQKLKTAATHYQLLIQCGVAAGFGAVFGTPLSGAFFAVEVLSLHRLSWKPLPFLLASAFLGDLTVRFLQVHHVHYTVKAFAVPGMVHLLTGLLVIGCASALAAALFTYIAEAIIIAGKKVFAPGYQWLWPVAGGLAIIIMALVMGTSSYLGLGVLQDGSGDITLPGAFSAGGSTPFSWLLKLLFTAVTIGTGFKGGEVTPLFFIGATLGNSLSAWVHLPVDVCAAAGFIAVFAAATKTPLACTLMGAELFGWQYFPIYLFTCVVAYIAGSQTGIYTAQQPAILPGSHPLHYLKARVRRYTSFML